MATLGCLPPSRGYLPAGLDTRTAERVISYLCDATLPREEGNGLVSLLDTCGGHELAEGSNGGYHFHENLNCLGSEADL